MLFLYMLMYTLKFVNLSIGSTEVDLKIELNKNGFHREMKYSVKFRKDLDLGSECDYLIKQSIPSSMYIMNDELANLKIPRKMDIIYPSFVNTEVFNENSEPFNIFIKIHSKISNIDISLPVHYRYHRSRSTHSAYADIFNPLVYATCYTPRSIYFDNAQSINTIKLFHGNSSFTGQQMTDKCNWILLKTDYKQKLLTAEIPVGGHDEYFRISIITISFSWIIVIHTLIKIHFVLQNKI